MNDSVEPWYFAASAAALDDLHHRIDTARWPEAAPVDDWSQGVPLKALQDFVHTWRYDHDWRRAEAWINASGLSSTVIDGVAIRFLHIRSQEPGATPLLLTHGWPGSILEFRGVVAGLTDPVAHGGRAEHAFHCIIPCLPGYGFSGKPVETGWGVGKIARAWGTLMARLGYDRWFAQGGDWGAVVTTQIGVQNISGCAGIHLNMPIAPPSADDLAAPDADDARALAALKHYQQWDSGYSTQQRTRPQTIGYALVDSPVALAAWIYEKMWAWTDNAGRAEDALSRSAMLDNLMLYWLTATGASSARLYWESFGAGGAYQITMPVACSAFPKEILPTPRKWVARHCPNLVHWGDMPRGGHFAAWEQPASFVSELRKAFALMR